MDRLTRAFYATSAAALLSFVAVVMVMLVVSAPSFSVEDGVQAGGTAVMVGDFGSGVRAG